MSDISIGRARIITPGKYWDACMKGFSATGMDDVYFDYRYINLNIRGGSKSLVEAFVFEEADDVFFLPYIRSPIPGTDDLWDFETAYGYGGPIATTQNRCFLKAAWNTFVSLAKERRVIVGLIRFHPLLKNDRFGDYGPTKVIYESDTVWLDCKRSLNEVMKDYSKKHLARLRRSERNGVIVKQEVNYDALNIFKEIYLIRMKALGARNEYNFRGEYFDGIRKLGDGRWSVFLVYSPTGVVIGGCLLLFSNRFCHYHLSGSLNEYLKLAPNDMLRHAVIKKMLDTDLEAIHFGGGRTSNPNDSLLAFKLKFSNQTSRFKMGACVLDPVAYETICRRWEVNNPYKYKQFSAYLLRYRF